MPENPPPHPEPSGRHRPRGSGQPPPAASPPGFLADPSSQPANTQAPGGDPADVSPELQAQLHARRLQALAVELARRRCEALRLYEPLDVQRAFHASGARIRLARGSNRSGKTLCCAVEVARAVTGQDPHGKYPLENGRWYCVAKDLTQLGEVVWPKLSRAGAFKMIRDSVTGRWRAYRPWEPEDQARESEAKLAPPLIPPRFIASIAWTNKAKGQPKRVVLTNGWELSFYTSEGKPPQGSDINGWWFDEEIIDASWFPEMSARVLDRHGSGIWSATPQAGTEQLFELHERAEKAKAEHVEHPAVEEFVVLLKDNPHMSARAKLALAEDLQSEDDYQVRIMGEFVVPSFRVYPEFSLTRHTIAQFPVPREWCRYLVVDPGHQVCAVLFAAVAPPHEQEHAGHVYLYDELYLKECDAQRFAEAVKAKSDGQCFQAFLIDFHYGLHTDVGSGRTVMEQYSTALEKQKVRSVATGSHFLLGCDDIEAGVLAVHGWLRDLPDGKPKLLAFRETMPAFCWEIKRYYKQRTAGKVIDKPNARGNNHLMDCLRYLALHGARYVKPRPTTAAASGAIKAFRAKQKRKEDTQGTKSVNMGPKHRGTL